MAFDAPRRRMGLYPSLIAPHPACGHLLPGGEGDHTAPPLLPPGEGGRRPDEGDGSRREVVSDELQVVSRPMPSRLDHTPICGRPKPHRDPRAKWLPQGNAAACRRGRAGRQCGYAAAARQVARRKTSNLQVQPVLVPAGDGNQRDLGGSVSDAQLLAKSWVPSFHRSRFSDAVLRSSSCRWSAGKSHRSGATIRLRIWRGISRRQGLLPGSQATDRWDVSWMTQTGAMREADPQILMRYLDTPSPGNQQHWLGWSQRTS